jgi:hypothetical protein
MAPVITASKSQLGPKENGAGNAKYTPAAASIATKRWPAGLTDNLRAHKVPAEERVSSLIQPSPRATTHTKNQYDKAMRGCPLD